MAKVYQSRKERDYQLKRLKITRTVSVTTVNPYNKHFYSDMTLEQAIESENNMSEKDQLQLFVEALEWSTPENRTFDIDIEVIETDEPDDADD